MNGETSRLALLITILGRWQSCDDTHYQMYQAVYDAVDHGLLTNAAEVYLGGHIVEVVQQLVADGCPPAPMTVRGEITRMQRSNGVSLTGVGDVA